MLLPVLFLFAGMACFGASNCLWKPLQLQIDTGRLFVLRSLWTVAVLLAVVLINHYPFRDMPAPAQVAGSIPWILLSLLGLWFFVRSTRYQSSGVSGTLILCLGFFGALAAWLGEGDQLPRNFPLLATLYVLGVVLLDPAMLRLRVPGKGTFLVLAAAACWALANLGFKTYITAEGVWVFSLVQESVVLLSGLALGLFLKTERTRFPLHTGIKMVWPLALLTLGGVIGCNLAMDRLSVMQFAWIAMVQPVTTLFVSSIIQREPLTIRQLTGGMVLISASILSSLWSV